MATAAPTPKLVDLTLRRIAKDELKGSFIRPPWKNDQEMSFKNKNDEGLMVSFTIEDDGGTGMLFPDDPAKALWVHPVAKKNDPCPPPGSTWPEFQATGVTNGNRTLEVRDFNSCPQLFKFALNFTTDPHNPDAKLESWDPIGDNRNGQNLASANLLIGAISLAAAAITAVAVASYARRGGQR